MSLLSLTEQMRHVRRAALLDGYYDAVDWLDRGFFQKNCTCAESESNCSLHGIGAYYERCAAEGRDSGD